jgi:hypothetical protein
MYRLFGLGRDPFAPVSDGALFWETPERAEVRARLSRLLAEGRGAWLWGPAGSGRETLLARVAEDLAAAGTSVLWLGDRWCEGNDDFLGALASVAVGTQGPGQGAELVFPLYASLLERFCSTGPVAVFLGGGLGEGARPEAEILGALRVAGSPVTVLALCGEGPPPLPDLEEVHLPAPVLEDLRDCIAHRVSVCGGADLFGPADLDAICGAAHGLGDAVRRAREALAGMAYRCGPTARSGPEGGAGDPVLDAGELETLGLLLGTTSP